MAIHYFLLFLFCIIKLHVGAQDCTEIILPSDIVVRRGSRAVLECSAGVLFWTINGRTINPESENDCSCEIENCGDLVFASISNEDAGISNAYECTVYDSSGISSATAHICIEKLPVFPQFFSPFQGKEGEEYVITIGYSGTCVSLPQVDLLKGSVSVLNDSNIQLQVTETSIVISFSSLTMADDGQYTLYTQNIAGVATTNIPLVVNHKPIFVEKNVYPGSLVLANSTAILSCNYSGYPIITVAWFDPSGTEITEGITVSTGDNGEWIDSQLELPSLSQSDEGSYTCNASNAVGNTINSINLQVTGPMNAPWIDDKGANEVVVSWDEPSDEYMISKYRVEYKKIFNGMSTWGLGNEVSVGTQQAAVTGLQGHTLYMIRIVYFASLGEFYGTPIQFRTLSRAPTSSPQQLQGITISKSILEVNWNEPELAYADGDTQVVGYRLWWASTEDNYKFALIDGSITRFTLLDLTPNTRYSLKAQANTEGGYGPNSTIVVVMTYPETYEFPTLLLEAIKVDSNWIFEWGLDGEYNVELQYYIRLIDAIGEIFDVIGPLSSNVTSYNFTNLDDTTYYKICIEVEVVGIQQTRNCTELLVPDDNLINPVNLAVWIATPIAGLVLFLCVLTTLLFGLLYACRTSDQYTSTISLKKTESDQSISSKGSMNARHPYTGEPLPQAPRSCLKYHSDRSDSHIKIPKQLRIGTEL